MIKIVNADSMPGEYISDPNFETLVKTIQLARAAGSEKLYVNIDYIKPGGKSAKYHSHSKQEEFFFVLRGNGILRIEEQEFFIKSGDLIAKLPGKNIAHQFVNNGLSILEILDCGLNEQDDIITYPDEGIIYIKDKKLAFNIEDALKGHSYDLNQDSNNEIIFLKEQNLAFNIKDAIKEWSSDPNQAC